jgi:hypothetical protein
MKIFQKGPKTTLFDTPILKKVSRICNKFGVAKSYVQ